MSVYSHFVLLYCIGETFISLAYVQILFLENVCFDCYVHRINFDEYNMFKLITVVRSSPRQHNRIHRQYF